jgi:hypothetical protein
MSLCEAGEFQVYYALNKYMSIFLYDSKSEEDFNNNINKIVDEVTIKRLELLEPTGQERKAVNEVIKKYISDNKRKIYGGYAFNTLIKEKNPKDAFYREFDTPDIEFYSPEPLQDLVNICNILHAQNFKLVAGKEAQHVETYTVFVNYEKYCDITYVPKLIYNRIPVREIDNLLITDPSFLMIDILRAYTDPITSYWRVSKTFKRALLLQKHYPIRKIDKPNPFPEKIYSENIEALTIIYEFLKDRKTTIVFGNTGYQTLMNEGKFPKLNDIPYFEFISTNYKDDCTELIKLLKMKLGDAITYVEYYPFFQFYGHNVIISYNGKPVAYIYHHNNKCTPYQDIDINKSFIRIGSFPFILNLLYILFHKARVEQNKELEKIRMYMISSLVEKRNDYLKKNKKTILDNTIFREFQVDCIGKTVDPPRLFRENIARKKEQHKPYLYSYDPNQTNNPDPNNFKFANTSGNEINKEKNRKL